MRTLTAPASTAAARPYVSTRLLAKIEFTVPSALTLYVSDTPLSVLGQEWLPLVADWGAVDEALNTVDLGGRPATAEMSFWNTKPVGGKARLSDLMRTPQNPTGTFEFANAKVTVYQLFEGQGSGDEITLGVLYLEEPTAIDQDQLHLRMSDQSLFLEDKMTLLRVSKDLFPNADPDDVGKPIPVAIGPVTGVPLRAVVAGAASTLSVASAPGATTLTVSDTSAFPAAPFTMQIELGGSAEQRTVTAKSATTFAFSPGLSLAHGVGATVFELRTGAKAYRFVACENKGNFKSKAVPKVFIHDGLAVTNYTVDLDDTTLVPGRSFVVVNFAAVPTVASITVSSVDTIAVSSPSASSASRLATNTPLTITPGANNSGTIMTSGVAGTIINVSRTLTYRILSPGTATVRRSETPGATGIILETGILPAGSRTFAWGSGVSQAPQIIQYQAAAPPNQPGNLIVDSLKLDIETTIQVNKTGTVTVSANSSADVIFGAVTCDLEGLKDDGSGTISGTPSLLLENPTDVTKLIMLALYPGVSAGDLGATWAVTRTAHALSGYKWAGLIGLDEVPKFSDLRKTLEEQARARFFLDGGKWQFKYRSDSVAADLTLEYSRDVWDQLPMRASRTPRSQVFNSLWVYSQRDYTKTGSLGERYRLAKKHEDLMTSGFPDAIQRDVELTLVQDASTANLLGTYLLSRWRRQRWEVTGVAWQNALAAEKVDRFAIANHPVLAAHGDALLFFEITGKKYRIGDDQRSRIELHGLEDGEPAVTVTAALAITWEALGQFAQTRAITWEAAAIGTPVSASLVIAWEALGLTALRAAIVAWEAQTGGVFFDASKRFDGTKLFGGD